MIEALAFYMFAVILITSAAMVISAKNPVPVFPRLQTLRTHCRCIFYRIKRMVSPDTMQMWDPRGATVCDLKDLYTEFLILNEARILDLGCGNGHVARNIATSEPSATVVAVEFDTIVVEEPLIVNTISLCVAPVEFRKYR